MWRSESIEDVAVVSATTYEPGLLAAIADPQLSAAGYKDNNAFYDQTNCRLGNELNAGAWVALHALNSGQWIKVGVSFCMRPF